MIRFISDLHLSPEEPATVAAFLRFLRGPARQGESLWILGDLFEYWAGDDDVDEAFNADIAAALAALTRSGVCTRLIVGNRDFLLGERFSGTTGVEIVSEPHALELCGRVAVLLHGDALCTDDHAYMAFRQMVRNPAWQAQFLAQPLAVRRKIAEDLRARSESAKQEKEMTIMDVNADAVTACLQDNGATLMIHGHTHRPARHALQVNGQHCERWVLSDWHGRATWLEYDGHTLSYMQEEAAA